MKMGTKQLNESVCTVCETLISSSADICHGCGELLGAPNVRSVNKEEEKRALEERYKRALERAAELGTQDRLKAFSQEMKGTCAVVNVDISFLHTFITNEKILYTSYSLGVRGQVRKPAEEDDDRQRLGVEGTLFGSYGEKIRYAALSLDGAGVSSYGSYSLKLREIAISGRSTLLEDNSYVFVEKHGIIAGKALPKGYRSTWEEREKLALAKLADRITTVTPQPGYASILLFSEGDFKTDDFIEIHIYGPFDAHSIESVRGSSTSENKGEAALIETVKEHLENSGKAWIEA